MDQAQISETTQLLRDWAGGDQAALNALTPRVYRELKRIAGHMMQGEAGGRTLQTTALVHEAYVRLIDVRGVDFQHRAQFFAIAATSMRRLLLDQARRRHAAKRGGEAKRVNLDEMAGAGTARSGDLVALDDALEELAKVDPRRAQVVEMRYFGGLQVEETAMALNVSADTVMRDWRLARAWLLAELSHPGLDR